jgi:polyisoprenoid-binding protein YceI
MLRLTTGALVAGVLLAVAAAGGWWVFIREDAKLATNAPSIPSELVVPSASPIAAGDTLSFAVIAEQSEAAYFVSEELARLSVPSTAKGSTKAVEGVFHLAAEGWELDPSRRSAFTVDVTTLKSDEDRRDNRVQDALQTSAYPRATFTVTSISGVDATIPQPEEHTFTMTGVLDLRGVKKDVTWDVKARRDQNVITALATTTFLFADFGIPIPNIAGFVSVEDDVTIQVTIVARAI